MFKYNINQTVYFVRDNKLNSAKVLRRDYSDHMHGDTHEKTISYYFGDRIGSYNEVSVFGNIDDILFNLRQNIRAF